MVNQTFYDLGTAPSVIRQLFAYGLEQAKIVGRENVFDYSLGNPSIPAPKKVNESIHKLVDETVEKRRDSFLTAPSALPPAAEPTITIWRSSGARRRISAVSNP